MKEWRGLFLPDGEDHMVEWMAKRNEIVDGKPTYQHHKLVAAVDLCTNYRNVVDVGSHCGLWAMHLVKYFEHVHAFEPVKAHRECFLENVPDLMKTTLYALALGSKSGMVNIRSNPTSSGDSWVDGPGDIPMYTLDSFELEDVDLLKIDCEGYELEVLKGAVDTLSRCHPVVVVEQKPGMPAKFGLPEKAAVTFLEGFGGYRVRKVISGDYILA